MRPRSANPSFPRVPRPRRAQLLAAAKDDAQYAEMRGDLLATLGGAGLLSFGPIWAPSAAT